MLKLRVTAVTHRGAVRRQNEDTVAIDGFCSSAYEGAPVQFLTRGDRLASCLIADGLGGHAAGARASSLAARIISDAATSSEPESIVRGFMAANTALYDEMSHSPAWRGMGTTVVAAFFTTGRMTCVNVGDSRCYQLVGTALVQLSTDDSPPPLPDEDGIAGSVMVTQTLGGTSVPVTVTPHVHTMAISSGDRFMLCSDGLTDWVGLDDIEKHLGEAADDAGLVRALLDAALRAGGKDNVSIALVAVEDDRD